MTGSLSQHNYPFGLTQPHLLSSSSLGKGSYSELGILPGVIGFTREGVTVFHLFPHIETVGQLLLGFPERMLHALFFDATLVFSHRASSDV
jgi:hypothetical protein